MNEPPLKHYVVVLKTEDVPTELRGRLQEQTRGNFGALAAAFASDVSNKVQHGDLPGVVAVNEGRSRSLAMVFVTATEDGVELLSQDERVGAISAGAV